MPNFVKLKTDRVQFAENFHRVYGVNLRNCSEHPEVMQVLRHSAPGVVELRQSVNPIKTAQYAHGCPFLAESRISGEQADKISREILKKWYIAIP